MNTDKAQHSTFVPGDHVAVNLGYSGSFGGAIVTAVRFTHTKIFYDLELIVERDVKDGSDKPAYNRVTRIHNVDGALVISRSEWLKLNEKKRGEKHGDIVLDSASLTFGGVYTSKDVPKQLKLFGEPNGMSRDVLIDLDGRRKNFRVGYYSYMTKEWMVYDSDEKVDVENMKWQHLNLSEDTKGDL